MLGSSLFADCLVSEVEYRGVKRFTFRELEGNSFYLGLFYERSFMSAGEKGGWRGGPRGSAPRRIDSAGRQRCAAPHQTPLARTFCFHWNATLRGFHRCAELASSGTRFCAAFSPRSCGERGEASRCQDRKEKVASTTPPWLAAPHRREGRSAESQLSATRKESERPFLSPTSKNTYASAHNDLRDLTYHRT